MGPYISGTRKQEAEKLEHLLILCSLPEDNIKLELERFWERHEKVPFKSSSRSFIGINPPEGQYTMLALYEKALGLPLAHYTGVVEQNTDKGIRPHLHIIADMSQSSRRCREIPKLAKYFNVNPNSIDFKISNNSVLNQTRLDYINGVKTQNKLSNQLKDSSDRAALNIPETFSK